MRLALATALHHSAQQVDGPGEVEEHEMDFGPRAQEAPPPGMRPAPPLEAAEPQLAEAARAYRAAGVSSLEPPCLADATAEGVDSSALAFLASRALLDRQEEEEARREEDAIADLEDKVAGQYRRLVGMIEALRGSGGRAADRTTVLERAIIGWYMNSEELRKRKGKRKKKRRKWRRRATYSSWRVARCLGVA